MHSSLAELLKHEVKERALVVGLVGGVASGKSAVASELAALGAIVLSADKEAHKVLQDPTIRKSIADRFGSHILAVDGSIVRARLAQIVFGEDARSVQNKQTLESIMHPAIRENIEHQLRAILSATLMRGTQNAQAFPSSSVAGPAATDPFGADNRKRSLNKSIVILDAPLLLEAGWQDMCDRILFIETPIEMRRALASQRGWSHDEHLRREQSQWSLDRKRAAATDVIQNRGPLSDLQQSAKELIDAWCHQRVGTKKNT